MLRLGGKVRSQVVFEPDHSLQTPVCNTRLGKPKFPNSMHSRLSLPSHPFSLYPIKSPHEKDLRKIRNKKQILEETRGWI